MAIAGGKWKWEVNGDLVKSTKFQLLKMGKFWRSNVQHDDYSEQYYIVDYYIDD